MELIRSHRPEHLADALASKVRSAPLGPFEKEVVVVQNRGIETWLTLALSERLGIWSNPSFPFPRSVIEEVLERCIGRSENAAKYAPERLKWTIARLLQESAPNQLRSYLGEASDPDRVLRLAESIASVFDDYVVFRPELLKDWVRGAEGGWQADLWRRVADELGPDDLASRIEAAMGRLRAGLDDAERPFQRLHLFAFETLPPLFLSFFTELSRSLETTLYVLEPSSEYLGDIDPSSLEPEATDGHALVSDLGRLSRDFQQLLLAVDDAVLDRAELFGSPQPRDLLSHLQADIVGFRSVHASAERQLIDPDDSSVSIHACAGPMREAQVLHECIRAALDSDPSLLPEDIVVLTPDIASYAPAFHAVFGQDEAKRIPYSVHDRRSRDDASIYDDFLAVLEVLDSRFSVFDLVRLMDAESMAGDFRFSPQERARLAELLAAAGIRWGIDAEHRAELEFPAEPVHTWRAGLGRLFLGFTSAPEATEAFEGLLPRGAPTLSDAELIARLSRLCETLFEYQAQTRKPLPVEAWAALLGRICTSLFAEDDESSRAVRTIREALAGLEQQGRESGYEEAIPLKAMRREVATRLGDATPAVGFMRRGVTLAELVPRRALPFRLVCLAGMSEELFPRADRRPSFDLTRQQPAAGDRNRRHEDRHAFLQALLCARDRVVITYGSVSDGAGSKANASPVVWDLRESVNRYYAREDGKELLQPLVHPLHSFDAAYFRADAPLRSSSERDLRIAEALVRPQNEPEAIELRAEENEIEPILSPDELSHWLWNPAKAFIERVLGARFAEYALYEPTSALTKVSSLDASKLGNQALRAGLRGDPLHAFLEAAPEFPDGTPGTLEKRALGGELARVNARADGLRGEPEPDSMLCSSSIAGLTLEGRIEGLGANQRLIEKFTKPDGRTELSVWLEHLLAQAATGEQRTTQLVLRGREEGAMLVSFAPVDDAIGVLEGLLHAYQRCCREPLPLLEKASRELADGFDENDPGKSLKAAKSALKTLRDRNAYVAYLIGSSDPFEDEAWVESFRDASLSVYEPFFAHRSES